MLSEGAGVGVGLLAPLHAARVRLVGGVNEHVFLAVRRVGESAITARIFTFEWLFS